MATVVTIDGAPVRPEEAVVSVFDRGFLYGDSVYEVARTYDGVPFELEAHLARLESSAERINMGLPAPRDVLAREVLETHANSGNIASYLRVVVTRGSGPIGLDIALAQSQRRIVIAKDVAEVAPPPEVYTEGVEVALVSVRRNLRTAIDPRAKTGNYLNSVMALAEARERGAYEAVMLDHRDYVTEGASSNVFVVVDDTLLTPPLDAGILEGVTRAVVLKVARSIGVKVLQVPLTADMLTAGSEVFITSSVREIVPVVRVDGERLGDGRPGPVHGAIREGFDAYVRSYVESFNPPGA